MLSSNEGTGMLDILAMNISDRYLMGLLHFVLPAVNYCETGCQFLCQKNWKQNDRPLCYLGIAFYLFFK